MPRRSQKALCKTVAALHAEVERLATATRAAITDHHLRFHASGADGDRAECDPERWEACRPIAALQRALDGPAGPSGGSS